MTVRDINDNAPILSTAAGESPFMEIEEVMTLSTEINVVATDPDKPSGTNQGDVRFAIQSCTCGKGIFKIDQFSGEVGLHQLASTSLL